MHRPELVAPELLPFIAGPFLLEEDRAGGGKLDADGADDPDQREEGDQEEEGEDDVGAPLDELREGRVQRLLVEADDIDISQLGDVHLALGIALHARNVLEPDHLAFTGGDEAVHVFRFRSGVQGAEHFLEGLAVLFDIFDGVFRTAEVRDAGRNLIRMVGEHAQYTVTFLRVGIRQELADLQHVRVGTNHRHSIVVGAHPADPADDFAEEQVPEDIEETGDGRLQQEELALEDELVDDGHQAVVQDEGDGGVQDGAVGDVHGGAAAFVDLDAQDPGGGDAADHQQEPGPGPLVKGEVLFTHHIRPVQEEQERTHLDQDVADEGGQLVEEGLLGGGLDDAEHKTAVLLCKVTIFSYICLFNP